MFCWLGRRGECVESVREGVLLVGAKRVGCEKCEDEDIFRVV